MLAKWIQHPTSNIDPRSGSDLALSGSDLALSGSDQTLSGSDFALSGSDLSGSDFTLSGSDLALSGSDQTLSGSDLTLSGSDLALFGYSQNARKKLCSFFQLRAFIIFSQVRRVECSGRFKTGASTRTAPKITHVMCN